MDVQLFQYQLLENCHLLLISLMPSMLVIKSNLLPWHVAKIIYLYESISWRSNLFQKPVPMLLPILHSLEYQTFKVSHEIRSYEFSSFCVPIFLMSLGSLLPPMNFRSNCEFLQNLCCELLGIVLNQRSIWRELTSGQYSSLISLISILFSAYHSRTHSVSCMLESLMALCYYQCFP